MVTALYAGSFDPFHNGHLAVVMQSLALFDRVVVTVLPNSAKRRPLTDAAQRVTAISAALRHLDRVEVLRYDGLTVEAAQACGADVIVRSYGKEFRDEFQMAATNDAAGVRTVFVAAPSATAHISSTFIRNSLASGRRSDVEAAVPREILDAITTT